MSAGISYRSPRLTQLLDFTRLLSSNIMQKNSAAIDSLNNYKPNIVPQFCE